jgi:uncharacterized membrane protein
VQIVKVFLAPDSVLGTTVTKPFSSAPEQQMWEDVRRFKQLMETGEIAWSKANFPGTHAARTPSDTTELYAGKV